jgi:3-oxoacyl-[acyl-carrier protein] reductase
MDLGLAKKHAVVLAASKGLGFAAAKELLEEGACVTICSSNEENLKVAIDSLSKTSKERVAGCVADLTSSEDIDHLFSFAKTAFGVVDILVTNTGGPKPGTYTQLSEDDWQDGFDLVFMSAVRAINHVLPQMKEKGWGAIVAITSISVKNPILNLTISNGMRAGLTGALKSLSDEVAAHNITVNSVCPGYIHTDRVDQLLKNSADQQQISIEEALNQITDKAPAKRLGKPEELASLIAFLASEKARYITGATYWVDGGLQRSLM